MEQTDILIIIAFSLFAILGLIVTALQKKGILHPVLTPTANSFHFVSGGTITFFSTAVNVFMIYRYCLWAAVLYAASIAGIYILIQRIAE